MCRYSGRARGRAPPGHRWPTDHGHGAVVGAEDLLRAHVPENGGVGVDAEAATSVGRQGDRVAIAVLEGVGAVAIVEERGVEAGAGLRAGLDPEVAESVASVELGLGGGGQQGAEGHACAQRQRLLHVPHAVVSLSVCAWSRLTSPACRGQACRARRADFSACSTRTPQSSWSSVRRPRCVGQSPGLLPWDRERG